MKHLFFVILLSGTLFSTSAFANNNPVNVSSLRSFETTFSNAKDVKWSQVKDLTKVEFTLDGRSEAAYYNNEGELVAVSEFLSSSELPVKIQQVLTSKLHDYWIADLFVVRSGDEKTYYVTLENNNEKLVLKSVGEKKWSVYKRVLKL